MDSKISRCIKTIVEMFNDRGYTVLSDIKSLMAIQLPANTKDKPIISIDAEHNGQSIICLISNAMIGKAFLRELAVKYLNKSDHVIIVSQGCTSITKKLITGIDKFKSKDIEMFGIDELQFNISRHVSVPRHRVIDSSKFKKAELDVLPKILSIDPISRYYNFRPLEVIQVERNDGSITHRLCI